MSDLIEDSCILPSASAFNLLGFHRSCHRWKIPLCTWRSGVWKGKSCLSVDGKIALTSQTLWKGPRSPEHTLRTTATPFCHYSSTIPYPPTKPDSLSPKHTHIFMALLGNKYFGKHFCVLGVPYGFQGTGISEKQSFSPLICWKSMLDWGSRNLGAGDNSVTNYFMSPWTSYLTWLTSWFSVLPFINRGNR